MLLRTTLLLATWVAMTMNARASPNINPATTNPPFVITPALVDDGQPSRKVRAVATASTTTITAATSKAKTTTITNPTTTTTTRPTTAPSTVISQISTTAMSAQASTTPAVVDSTPTIEISINTTTASSTAYETTSLTTIGEPTSLGASKALPSTTTPVGTEFTTVLTLKTTRPEVDATTKQTAKTDGATSSLAIIVETSVSPTIASLQTAGPSKSGRSDITMPANATLTSFTQLPTGENASQAETNSTDLPATTRGAPARAAVSRSLVIGIIIWMVALVVLAILLLIITRYRVSKKKAERARDAEEVPLNEVTTSPEATGDQSDHRNHTTDKSNKPDNNGFSSEPRKTEQTLSDVPVQPLIDRSEMSQASGEGYTPTSPQEDIYSTVAVRPDGTKSTVRIDKQAPPDVQL